MSWVEPLERDHQRFTMAYRNTNISSVGTGAGYGLEFDLDLRRMDELMGFDAEPLNARDSIRNYDYLIETYMATALMHNTLGRLAMDLLIWHSPEYGFIQLPDRLCITSSISPQMRVPYVLEFIHGTSGLTAGRLQEALSITKTASDQLEMATMLPTEFAKCAEESRYAIAALCELLEGMTVDTARMARHANEFGSQMNAFIGYAVKEKGVPYRTAHQILAKLMQRVSKARLKPADIPAKWVEQAALDYTGKPIGITQSELETILDAMYSVRQRKYRAGAAPERVREHISQARRRLDADRRSVAELSDKLIASEHRLDTAFAALKRRTIA
jgi:argininosuccinate lyase